MIVSGERTGIQYDRVIINQQGTVNKEILGKWLNCIVHEIQYIQPGDFNPATQLYSQSNSRKEIDTRRSFYIFIRLTQTVVGEGV